MIAAARPLRSRPVKVVLAPDKFAGTLSAAGAADAMAAGWARARPGDEIVLAPMADGGEGTLDVVAAAVPGAVRHTVEVADARGHPCQGGWLALPDGRALIESAQAIGLTRLAPDRRDPREATSYGLGQLLAAVAAHGATGVIVGLGGSATVDGGAGMAIALGHALLRADGNGLRVGGRHIADLDRVEPLAAYPLPVLAAADVRSPLLGPAGAVAVFAPQKGAPPDALPSMEAALAQFAEVVERDLGGVWRDEPGAGAAGGVGFGLAAFCRAELCGGAALIADLVGLPAAVAGADVVLTGEGALDAQTTSGKVAAHLLAAGHDAGARVLAVAGRIADDAGAVFDGCADLGPDGPSAPARAVAAAAERLARAIDR